AWIVATPELLYSYDKQNRTSHTMALAGTRECTGDSLPWDEKNTHEHALVADYISRKLKQAGLEPKITGPHTSHFGKIEHLCTSFDIFDKHLSEDRVFSIIDALNPTPAVAGYPKETAIASIGRVEKHNRSCYGGYIGLSTDKSYTAVVNLRCLSFTSDKYCIYAGGGIMPESNIQNEWDETEAKSALARSIIKDLSSR
ncbi:MAG: chorismate-binding protein, partial [Muribaculaceae bacterium]|nr:chorismate-binding protein [Muribaculaceae bacterium]